MAKAKTVKIKQIGSPIRRPESQKKILIGLGLNKMHKIVERQDTPEVRGAIAKIPHVGINEKKEGKKNEIKEKAKCKKKEK